MALGTVDLMEKAHSKVHGMPYCSIEPLGMEGEKHPSVRVCEIKSTSPLAVGDTNRPPIRVPRR